MRRLDRPRLRDAIELLTDPIQGSKAKGKGGGRKGAKGKEEKCSREGEKEREEKAARRW